MRSNDSLAGKSPPELSTNGARGFGLVVAWASSASHWAIPRGDREEWAAAPSPKNRPGSSTSDQHESVCLVYNYSRRVKRSQIFEKRNTATFELDLHPIHAEKLIQRARRASHWLGGYGRQLGMVKYRGAPRQYSPSTMNNLRYMVSYRRTNSASLSSS